MGCSQRRRSVGRSFAASFASTRTPTTRTSRSSRRRSPSPSGEPDDMADTQTFNATGRRKEAVCRVFVRPGSGKWDVNGRTLGDYFPRPSLVSSIQQPFVSTDTLGRFDVKANVDGGGTTGQAGALRLAVARALVLIDEVHRRKLRDLGLLTRDARAVERKKPGRPKARKRFQFSKR